MLDELDAATIPEPLHNREICAACRFWGRTQRAGGWRMCYHPKPHALGVGGQRVVTLPNYGCSQWASVEKDTP